MRVLAIIATLVALIFAALFLRTFSVIQGGGQSDISPDGMYVANAQSLRNTNPIAADRRTYYEFTISQGATHVIKRVVFHPSEQNSEMYFRELPNIVEWSPNSEEVTFTIPGATLKLDVHDHPESRSL